MAAGLPPGFVDLQTASDRLNEDLNIMGVVVDFLPPTRSRGTDYMSTFSLADSTGYDGLKVRFFRPMESEHPSIQGTGDVVILIAVKVKVWSGMKIALSSFNTAWTVFPAAAIPESAGLCNAKIAHNKGTRMKAPTVAETLYAITLCNSQDRSTFTAPIQRGPTTVADSSVVVSSAAVNWNKKFSLIKDVKIDTFYDVVGQVVKTYFSNGRCELYFTDYTSNNLMYNYEWGRSEEEEGIARDGDEHGYLPKRIKNRDWPGPYGKLTLQVALWEPHSYFAMQSVKDADWIHLRNLRIKLGQDGKLEGCLHTDMRYPERIDVTILKDHEDDRVKEVMRRKRDYWLKAKSQSSELVQLTRGQKKKQAEGTEGPLKGRGKRRKQQQQQQQQQQQKQKAPQEIKAIQTPPLDRNETNKHSKAPLHLPHFPITNNTPKSVATTPPSPQPHSPPSSPPPPTKPPPPPAQPTTSPSKTCAPAPASASSTTSPPTSPTSPSPARSANTTCSPTTTAATATPHRTRSVGSGTTATGGAGGQGGNGASVCCSKTRTRKGRWGMGIRRDCRRLWRIRMLLCC